MRGTLRRVGASLRRLRLHSAASARSTPRRCTSAAVQTSLREDWRIELSSRFIYQRLALRRLLGCEKSPLCLESVHMRGLYYRAFFPLCRKVWKMTLWKVPSAGGLILQEPIAQCPGRPLQIVMKSRTKPCDRVENPLCTCAPEIQAQVL